MTIETPEFQGTHLWERLHWAKEKLEPIQSDYRVVWEDPNEPDEPAKITIPDPNWLACALQGGILPPVEVYWELKKDEAQPDFKKHTRGYLLHNTKPVDKMTEEEAMRAFKQTQRNDKRKDDWAKSSGYKMIRIKHNELVSKKLEKEFEAFQ